MISHDSHFVRIFLLVFFALLGGYAIYEGWGLFSGPTITVPAMVATVADPYFLVTGEAKRITELRLNGASIPVTEEGAFAEPHILAPGSNRLVLEARDARGRTDRVELDIAYPTSAPMVAPAIQATTTPAATTTPSSEGV